MTDIELAKEIAHRAHAGQQRRNGEPYINHVRRVVGTLLSQGADAEVIAAAWLHDVIEDNGEDYGIMLELFPKEIAIAVFRLTRYKGFPYDLYIEEVKKNPIATQVKLADLLDNLQDNDNPSQVDRYTKALLTLTPMTEPKNPPISDPPRENCCAALGAALCSGTDGEGYGPLAGRNFLTGEIFLGSITLGIRFCPWCGAELPITYEPN